MNHITITGDPLRPMVTVDGVALHGLRGLTFSVGVDRIPVLTAEVMAYAIDVDGQAVVLIPDRVRDTLIQLGWTPPADPPADADVTQHDTTGGAA
jgi:hypothetical protein